MPDSVLGKIAVEIGGGTAANGGGGGSPSSTSIAGGGDSETKKQLGLLGKMRDNLGTMTKNSSGEPRFWTKALKTMGIQVGLAGILKQSQIFTSTLGSLFQILGAFVDVILAPWMPLFIPMIRKLARQIPVLKKWSENVYKQVTEVYGPWIKNMATKLWNWAKTAWAATKEVWTYITDKNFFGNVVKDIGGLLLDLGSNIVKDMLILLKRAWNWVAAKLPDMFGDDIKKGFGDTGDTSWERRKKEQDELAKDKEIRATQGPGNRGQNLDYKLGAGLDPWGGKPPKDDDRSLLDKLKQDPFGAPGTVVDEIKHLGEEFQNANWKEQGKALAIISGAALITNKLLTSVRPNLPIIKKAVELNPARWIPGSGIVKAGANVVGKPAELAVKAGVGLGKKGGQLSLQAIEALIGRPITPGGAGGLGDEAFDAGTGMYKATREWYTNARGKMVFGIRPKAVETLDEMVDPSRLQKLKRKIPKPTGILDFSKRVGGLGDEAGEVVGERGVARVVKPVVSATKTIAVEQLKKAIAKIEEFRGWLAKVKPGQSNLVLQANARMKVLWGAFGSIAHLPGGAALRPAFSYLTRAAKFLIPGLATVFVVRETKYEVEKMMKADMPWLKDPGNIESWKADAGVIGSGAAAGATSPYGGGIAQMLNIGPWGKDKEMGQASQRYMEAQALHFQEGALSQGKLAPIMMRLLGGSMELGGSLVGTPLGLALAGGGFGMNELARQRMGMGMGEGESYTEAQMMHDFRMLVPGWDSKTQKITIDGADGSQYTSGAET